MTDICKSRPIDVAIAATLVATADGDRILLTLRHPDGILPDSWELPGGKLEPGEDPARAAARELEEETGIRPERLETLGTWDSPESRPPVRLHAFIAHVTGPMLPPITLSGPVDARWISPAELATWPLPASNAPITAEILTRLGLDPHDPGPPNDSERH